MEDKQIPERTILGRRLCKHGCGKQIYLQHISVNRRLQWVCFDIDGKIHDCPLKPLGPDLKQLIQKAIDRMRPENILTNTNPLEIMDQIDIVIENLKHIRRCLIGTQS
jgi:hypothetical protein